LRYDNALLGIVSDDENYFFSIRLIQN